MQKMFDRKEVKWGLIGLALLIIPFWPLSWPFSVAVILVCLHALGTKVPLEPLRLLGALAIGLTFGLLRLLNTALPGLDHPEVLVTAPFLYGLNMAVGAFIPRAGRFLRPGRLIGLGLIWLAFYLFAPLPGVTWTSLIGLGVMGWLLLAAGAFGLVVGDYHRPLQGLRDLRGDNYWHGQRLTEQEEQVREGGRQGEQAVQAVLQTLDWREYTCYHGVHLRSQDRQLPKSQEFDHIVVGPNGVLHLETKNWRGKVVIKPSGEWMRAKDDGTLYPWESPVLQVERHHKVLRSVLAELNIPVAGYLVMTNRSTQVEGTEHTNLSIIPVDQLKQLIEGISLDRPLSRAERKQIRRQIEANIIPADEAKRQFAAGGKFIWHPWHWLVIDAVGSLVFLYLSTWI
jgi:hypothetical protein